MSTQGFDTWIVEVRGAGLSSHNNFKADEHIPNEKVVSDGIESKEKEYQNGVLPGQKELDKGNAQTSLSDLQSVSQLNDVLFVLTEEISDYLSETQSKVVLDDFLKERLIS